MSGWPGGSSLELITCSEVAGASLRFLYIVSDIGPVLKVNYRGSDVVKINLFCLLYM